MGGRQTVGNWFSGGVPATAVCHESHHPEGIRLQQRGDPPQPHTSFNFANPLTDHTMGLWGTEKHCVFQSFFVNFFANDTGGLSLTTLF